MFRGRSTLTLFVIALGLVCYLTFIDKKIPGTLEREKADAQLFNINQDDVTGMDISTVKGSFSFQKKGDHWEITSPVNTLADSATLDEIVGQIAYAQPQRTIPLDGSDQTNQSNLRAWGLDPAADKAVIHLKDKSVELLVGREIAINPSVYARTSEHHNAPVRVIPDTIKTALEKTLSDFRSRSVFDFQTDHATRIATSVAQTPTTPAQECEVIKKPAGWELEKPLVARASADDVGALLDKILALRVTDFVTDDPGNLAQYGLTSPSSTITVSVGPDDDGVLQIGSVVPGHADQVYAQRLKSNAIFTLPQTTVADIVKALPNVRDRHILPFDPGSVTAIDFDVTGDRKAKADLSRDKSGVWQVTGPSAGTADVGKVTDLLTRLSVLQTTPAIKDSAPDLKPFGLDQPTGHVSLTLKGTKTPLTLTIGKTENNLTYVRNSIEPFIYTAPAGTFTFFGDSLSYREKRVITLTAAKVKSMTITAQGEPSLTMDRSPGGTWTAENAKDRAVDATKADAQASILCDLQAQAWLGAAKPEYGLDHPLLTLAIMADNPTETVLKIGAALPDGSHAAQLKGSPDVFALSEGDYGLLNASTLQLIPGESATTNAAPATNVPAATNAPSASPDKPTPPEKKKKKKSE
jgi:hypothetical protein